MIFTQPYCLPSISGLYEMCAAGGGNSKLYRPRLPFDPHKVVDGCCESFIFDYAPFAAKYNADALFYKATHDAMTGLANRAFYIERLRNALALHRRDKRPASVLMIDMDGLKTVNDCYGHRAGDALIKEFAKRSKTCARATDTVARLGGDEFAMILSPVDLPDGVNAAIGRIQSALEAPFHFEDRIYQLHASIGSAQFPDDSGEIESLLELADQRMYAIKRLRKQERPPPLQ